MKEVIPVKKRIYRRIPVKSVQLQPLVSQLPGAKVVVAIDVAKHDMVAALATDEGQVVMTVAWKHPTETGLFFGLLESIVAAGKTLQAVMEPSGTYGDALRFQLRERAIAVFRVGSKRTHDAAEVYDSVPSMHDAKAAAILARLHAHGLSTPWVEPTEQTRELKAALIVMELHQNHYLRGLNVLEAMLSRHWPELLETLELTSATILALVARIGGPADVADQPEEAQTLLRGMSHGLMKPERIEAAVRCASGSIGVPLLTAERIMLRAIAEELHRTLRAYKRAKQAVEELSATPEITPLAKAVGKTTAAVLIADVGSPKDFPCAKAYVKALGINLKERSSGTQQGRPRLSKRGPARARKFLWFAVLRWIQRDAVVAAWYRSKVARDGGVAMSAIGALMRKLAKALYHVARGAPLDTTKLFDVTHLRLPTGDLDAATRGEAM